MANTNNSGSLLIQYNSLLCLANESSLYLENDPEDFRTPYTIKKPNTDTHDKSIKALTPTHLSSIAVCVSSAHDLFETFISMSTNALHCSPFIIYARLMYSVVVLVKISASIVAEKGALHGIMELEEVRTERYLERIVRKLMEISANGCRIAEKSLVVTRVISAWFRSCLHDVAGDGKNSIELGLVTPLKCLDIGAGDSSQTLTAYSLSDNGYQTENTPLWGELSSAEKDFSLSDWFHQLNSFPDDSAAHTLPDLDIPDLHTLASPSIEL